MPRSSLRGSRWLHRVALAWLLGLLGAPVEAAEWMRLHLLRSSDVGALIAIEVAEGAHAGRWLIDTASTVNLAAPHIARPYRIADPQRIGLHTAQGRYAGPLVELPQFRVGELAPLTLKAVEFDLEALVGPAAEGLAGVLGAPFLADVRLELDLPNARARMLAPGRAAETPLPASAPVILAVTRLRGLPVVQLRIGERAAEGYLFDTGHAGALVRLAGHAEPGEAAFAAPRSALARRVTSGALVRKQVPLVDLPGSALGRALPPGVVGSAGIALFETCRVTLELAAERLELAGCDVVTLPGSYGLQLQHDRQRLHITLVLPGGPAERAGLRAGDEIVRLGQRRQFASLGAAWDELASSADVEVGVRRGASEFVRRLTRAYFLPALP